MQSTKAHLLLYHLRNAKKKTLEIVYILLIIVMATGTIIGKYTSLDYVSDNIFGSWWFCLLWAMGTAAGIVYFIQRKVRRPIIILLHLSLSSSSLVHC